MSYSVSLFGIDKACHWPRCERHGTLGTGGVINKSHYVKFFTPYGCHGRAVASDKPDSMLDKWQSKSEAHVSNANDCAALSIHQTTVIIHPLVSDCLA